MPLPSQVFPRSCRRTSTLGTETPGGRPKSAYSFSAPHGSTFTVGESGPSLLPGEYLFSLPVAGGGREVRSGGVETLGAASPGERDLAVLVFRAEQNEPGGRK